MAFEIDEALAEIQRLGRVIENTPPGPERAALEAQRDGIRAQARLATDVTRPTAHLRAELANTEAQLADLDSDAIKPALNEHYKLITDPAAYRRRINESIAANTALRRAELEQRRQELLDALEQRHDG